MIAKDYRLITEDAAAVLKVWEGDECVWIETLANGHSVQLTYNEAHDLVEILQNILNQ